MLLLGEERWAEQRESLVGVWGGAFGMLARLGARTSASTAHDAVGERGERRPACCSRRGTKGVSVRGLQGGGRENGGEAFEKRRRESIRTAVGVIASMCLLIRENGALASTGAERKTKDKKMTVARLSTGGSVAKVTTSFRPMAGLGVASVLAAATGSTAPLVQP